MKPKRHKGHGSGTLIASLQVLLSKANSLEISQSLKSLLTLKLKKKIFIVNASIYSKFCPFLAGWIQAIEIDLVLFKEEKKAEVSSYEKYMTLQMQP